MNLRSASRVLATSICFVQFLSVQAQTLKPYEGMEWRLVGPFRGGRSIACAGSQARPQEYYFGATGGGVWKSTNGGTDWNCVSDGFFNTASVGALAVAASNPDVVYAGTGERDIRGNISHGDGVYRSTDAGKTWAHIGLKACQTISRIVVHPTNPDIVYVAAFGHVYVNRDLATGKIDGDPNRGVYKSTDGGKNWKKILYKNEVSGAVDLCMDPSNPEILYAATWESWRTPYMMNSGGPGSGIFKTTNGGTKWDEITRAPGLPKGVIGKVGLSVSPVNPQRVWAHIEALDGGIFRSDDGGKTFAMTNDSRNWRQRAWYYTHIIADTKNADTAYVLNVGAGRTTDGGKTFGGLRTPHSDNHDLWIAPDDPKRMIVSNDGGAAVSTDGGSTWTEQDTPTAQFYHVSTDNAFPYRILGAQQDNSTVRILSRTFGAGITRTDWTGTAGGESGYVVAKPDDPEIVFGGSYGGDLSRMNHRTNISRAVDPWPDNPMGHGAVDLVERFQWTFPIVFSPHDPNVLYTCSQHVMRSTDNGNNWFNISPDLTRNDKRTLGPSGGPITKDNTSVEYYGTVFT
ncbi:MAG: glycosyl hydrolase, partial [Fimbriimonadaceae bacterium]